MFTKIHEISSFLVLGACVCFVGFVSNSAVAASGLSESDVRAFINDTTDMISLTGGNDPEEIRAYLEDHLHEDSRFKTTTSYVIPGSKTQKNGLSLNKEEYIETVLKAPEAVSDDFEQKIKITNVKISKDGKYATVKTTSTESGSMKLPTGESVPIDGSSKCTQTLTRGDNDMIQMYSAQCTTTVEFSEIGF